MRHEKIELPDLWKVVVKDRGQNKRTNVVLWVEGTQPTVL